jgi:ABC-type oligopeptide transport system ATPase subunit
MSTLQIDQVSKVFAASSRSGEITLALRQVSFGIDRGEVVTLIGESGSGKTTLGKIILRLTLPTGGKVTFEGDDISRYNGTGLRDYYRNVQGVFQDPFSSYNPIYRADRVFELIRGVYFAHLPHQAWQAKIESALQAVSLNPGDVLGKYPHQLSGGQQQRLLIARALLLDVKLLVADEIISMLDASTRVDILNLLITLKRSGLAILFITHDLSLGNYVSDRTVILRRGAIVEMGDTVKVFTNPRHPYTQNLLAAVPELHKKWEGQIRPVDAGRAPSPDLARAVPVALQPPVLTECEPGHLVAGEEPEPVLTRPSRASRRGAPADGGAAARRVPQAPRGR